jgi:hypothetical protein
VSGFTAFNEPVENTIVITGLLLLKVTGSQAGFSVILPVFKGAESREALP